MFKWEFYNYHTLPSMESFKLINNINFQDLRTKAHI